MLSEFGLTEDKLTLFRYRGHGNPGPTGIENRDGRSFEKTYSELWDSEAGWELETRCKLCPDALGEAADVAAADVWSGGAPVDEGADYNGTIVRSGVGKKLVTAAAKAGDLVVGEPMTPSQFDNFQPHQVRKKEVLAARFHGFIKVGLPVIDIPGLRIAVLGERLDPAVRDSQTAGTVARIRQGRVTEPLPDRIEREP